MSAANDFTAPAGRWARCAWQADGSNGENSILVAGQGHRMSEVEWLTCSAPDVMLAQLHERRFHVRKAGRRKLRLFGCACCRRAWAMLDERGRGWVEWAERIADGAPPLSRADEVAHQYPGLTAG